MTMEREFAEKDVKATADRVEFLKKRGYHEEDQTTSHYAIYRAAEWEHDCAKKRLAKLQ